MPNLLEILPIEKAHAQAIDASAQPTWGPLDIVGSDSQSGQVLLKSSNTSIEEGKRFTVRVELKTNNIAINEYRIVVQFDASALQVVDQDPEAEGTQVALLDQIFEVESQEDDNTVTSGGVITLIATIPSGNSITVNRDIIEITFQAQKQGSTIVRIVEGPTGTRLLRQTGSGLQFTTNQVTVQTVAAGTVSSSSSGVSSSSNTTGGVTEIPVTGIEDNMDVLFGTGLGLFLIAFGVSLVRNKKKSEVRGR